MGSRKDAVPFQDGRKCCHHLRSFLIFFDTAAKEFVDGSDLISRLVNRRLDGMHFDAN